MCDVHSLGLGNHVGNRHFSLIILITNPGRDARQMWSFQIAVVVMKIARRMWFVHASNSHIMIVTRSSYLRSDNCNNYTLDAFVKVKIAPKKSCFGHVSTEILQQISHKILFQSESMCKGLACTVERINNALVTILIRKILQQYFFFLFQVFW